MALRPGDSFAAEFHVHNASGALANADSAPTGVLVRNSVADTGPSIAVATAATGIYRVSGTVPSGYASGDLVQVRITATVGGESTSGLVELGVLDGARVAEVFARIGAGGAGLSAVPWSNAWDAELQSGVAGALTSHGVATAAELTATRIRTGTAQSGSASTIRLDSGASNVDDFYAGALVYIRSGPGAGQARAIISYAGSTRTATVDVDWVTPPTSTSVFDLYPGSPIASLDQVAAAVLREPIADHEAVQGSVAAAIAQGGEGGGATPAEVETAVLAALGSYNAPTRGELAAELASVTTQITDALQPISEDTRDTIPGLLNALNNLDAVAVQAAAAAAISDYDPPTHAELQAVQTAFTNLIAALNDAPDLSVPVMEIAGVTSRLSAMIEDVNGDRWTGHALEQAPTGSGSGDGAWTVAQRDQVMQDAAEARAAAEAAIADIAQLHIPTAGLNAQAVRDELADELARIDTAISSRSAAGTAMTLVPQERATLAAAILAAREDSDGASLQELIRLMLAWIGGRVTGAAGDGEGATLAFQNPSGTKTRIEMTVDHAGNRALPATLDLT